MVKLASVRPTIQFEPKNSKSEFELMTEMTTKKAVVLLSGGLDSFTSAAFARSEGFELYGLTIDYGQRHKVELECALKIAQYLKLKDHKTVKLDLRSFGGSALTADLDVPKDSIGQSSESSIPITYVPARNTIMLSLALGWAEVLGAFDIFIGANAVDYSGYPDCRGEFMQAFEILANLATKAGVEGAGHFRIHTPLLNMTKAEIIRSGLEMGLDYSLSHSCYDPDENGIACGRCDSCTLRRKGFEAAGTTDPVRYQ